VKCEYLYYIILNATDIIGILDHLFLTTHYMHAMLPFAVYIHVFYIFSVMCSSLKHCTMSSLTLHILHVSVRVNVTIQMEHTLQQTLFPLAGQCLDCWNSSPFTLVSARHLPTLLEKRRFEHFSAFFIRFSHKEKPVNSVRILSDT